MGPSWSESVGAPQWRSEAQEWIHDALAQQRITVNGRIEQPRIRPWSTQMTVPTSVGTVWFKANCAPNRFEARLQQTLAELVSGRVARPLAIDPVRGWMLTRDHGPSLGDRHEPTAEDWQEVVSQAARMQRELVDEGPALLATGLPDYSASTVPGRFDGLVERLAGLPVEHPSHLSGEQAARLEQARERVSDAAARVDESPIPATFVHGDVHPWNVFVDRERLMLFDFGDSQWAFALEELLVPYGWIVEKRVIAWEPVRDAYREHWSDLVGNREFEALWGATGIVQAVNRSATWWRALQGASIPELAEWGSGAAAHLLNVLESPVAQG